MKIALCFAAALLISLPLVGQDNHQLRPDASLLDEINHIQAIDNHSHPPALDEAGQPDDDFDALPCYPLEPTADGLMFRADNPVYIKAWQAMFGYKYNDATPEHVKELLAAKEQVKQREGENYPNWVLDQLGIESELANRVAMGRGLKPTALPLGAIRRHVAISAKQLCAGGAIARSQDFLRPGGDAFRAIFAAAQPEQCAAHAGAIHRPKSSRPCWNCKEANGAVAIKFEAAYLRALDFAPAKEADAARVYARYVKGGVPSDADYKTLQDYLFRYLAREAGRLGMAVHLHTGGGCGGYFALEGSNPLLLDSVFNDPTLRKTNFVMLHGGAGGFEQTCPYLLMKPNVYADFSEQTWMTSPRHIAASIRFMLEFYPEKVLFGTDLYPLEPQVNWEETGYQTSTAGRTALAIALTGMMQDGEITREQAGAIAHMVMHDNAAKLYGLGSAPPQ